MAGSRSKRRTVIDRPGAVRAAEEIQERRSGGGREDEDLWRFPGVDALAGLAVVDYVQRYQRVDEDVLREDALAALAILNFLAGDVDRRQMHVIRLARRLGLTWNQIKAPMGVDSYQGAEQVYLRLCARFEGEDGTRDERVGRALRRRPARRATPAVVPVVDDAELGELRAALGELLALEEALPDDLADDLLDLRREVTPRRAELGPGQLRNALRVIANDMRDGDWPAPVAAALSRLVTALG